MNNMQKAPDSINKQPSTAELEAQQAALKAQENPGILRNIIKFGEEDLRIATDPTQKAAIEAALRSNLQKLISKLDNPAEVAIYKAKLGALLDSKYMGKNNNGIDFEKVDVAEVIKNKPSGAFDLESGRKGAQDSGDPRFATLGKTRTMGDPTKPFNWKDVPDTGDRPPRTSNPSDDVGRINL
jgi:hypothetical protein